MKIADALQGVTRLVLDTAPIIYYVEKNPSYFTRVQVIFESIDSGSLTAVTSPVTLAECLVAPYRLGSTQLQQDFFDLIVRGRNTEFVQLDQDHARVAAELRARYNITLTDTLQIAVGISAGCQAILTNDSGLKRLRELSILIVDDLIA